jgi:hypothetical protein
MKVVWNGILLAFVVMGVLYALIRLPYIQAAMGCYTTMMEAYDHRGAVIKQAYLSEEKICLAKKEKLLEGLSCFQTLPDTTYLIKDEEGFLDYVAKSFARATRTPIQAVNDHNQRCNSKLSQIVFDLDSPDPYRANFE